MSENRRFRQTPELPETPASNYYGYIKYWNGRAYSGQLGY
jgi:hypothetical protein